MFFPLYINLESQRVLVIGGGRLANRKTKTLREYGANITVYSKDIIDEELKERKDINFVFENVNEDEKEIEQLVDDYFFVITATDNHELNDKVATVCMNKGILVNNVSSKSKMNSMFGAIVKNSEFHISISTNGQSCKRSKALKGRVQKVIDEISK